MTTTTASGARGGAARAGRAEKQVFHDPRTGHEIWQMTRSGQASFHSYYDLCPWSPDGAKILFCAITPGGDASDIYWLDAVEGTLHSVGRSRLINPHTGANQQWLGRGERLAYEDRDENGRFVRIVDLATGAETRADGALRMVSPDGRVCAGHTDPHDEAALRQREAAGLFLTALDGGRPRLIASLAAALEGNPRRDTIATRHLYIKHPKWSPMGERLFFVFTNEIHLYFSLTWGAQPQTEQPPARGVLPGIRMVTPKLRQAPTAATPLSALPRSPCGSRTCGNLGTPAS